MKHPIQNTLDLVAQTIFDRKGFNILALDVRGISTMTDYYLIAEGNIDRHVRSIALSVKDTLKEEEGRKLVHMEGEVDGDWVVVDYGEFVLHVLIPEMREKYALEELWKEGKIVDLNIALEQVRKGK
jgi:ribosome-associated protein